MRGDTITRTLSLAHDLLEAERREPVLPYRDPEHLAAEHDFALGEPTPEGAVFDALRHIVLATPRTAPPRFFNQLFSGRDPIAVSAEVLSVLLNSSMYTYKVAGPQVLLERELIRRMGRRAGYADPDGVFTPGGSLSNLTALVVARNQRFPDARERGLRQPATMYTSLEGHYSIRKAAGIAGLGRENVRDVACDEAGRMDVEELRRAVAADRAAGFQPFFVNATAGTTQRGAFDPIDAIADVASDEGLWLHVDGALGGSVLLSEKHRHRLRGLERTDSFSWDPHKMMGVPLVCSVVLLRREGLLRSHFDEVAGYLFQSDETDVDPGHRTLQCGRRNDALKLWAAWKTHGDAGWAKRIDHLFGLARYAAARIRSGGDLRLLERPPSINVCFEVVDVDSCAICEELHHQGRALVGHAEIGRRSYIRLVCANADAQVEDIDRFLEDVRDVACGIRGGKRAVGA